jgi:ATP-dependent DNA helicase RecG
MEECTIYDRKSLKTVQGKTADFAELAKDCVAFANAKGGFLHIGIEDGETLPPASQLIDSNLPERIIKRINELTINVGH